MGQGNRERKRLKFNPTTTSPSFNYSLSSTFLSAIIVIMMVAVVVAGLLVFFKKRLVKKV
jgi:hypothetical protein